MSIEHQMHRASVNVAKAFRQFQKADSNLANDEIDSAVTHLNGGLDYFSMAMDHMAKAEDEAYGKAGSEVQKANQELQKSIDDYVSGNVDSAWTHYVNALDEYDQALELMH